MIDIIAGLVCAVLAAMGVGGGGLLVIYLTLVKGLPQIYAQGVNLLFFLPSALVSLFFKRKLLASKKKLLLTVCPTAVLSSLGFSLIGGYMDEALLRRIFGAFLILAALIQIFSKKSNSKDKRASGGEDVGRKVQKGK